MATGGSWNLPCLLPEVLPFDAVHWSRSSINNRGLPSFASAVAIKCRWEDANQIMTTDRDQSVKCSAKINPSVRVEIGDYLLLSDLDSVSSVTDPSTLGSAVEVISSETLPDLDGIFGWHTCYAAGGK